MFQWAPQPSYAPRRSASAYAPSSIEALTQRNRTLLAKAAQTCAATSRILAIHAETQFRSACLAAEAARLIAATSTAILPPRLASVAEVAD
jgi:hypothetical protein